MRSGYRHYVTPSSALIAHLLTSPPITFLPSSIITHHSSIFLRRSRSRFLINIPEEDKDDPVKLVSHVETAYWFYLDLQRPEDPSLPACSMKEFMAARIHETTTNPSTHTHARVNVWITYWCCKGICYKTAAVQWAIKCSYMYIDAQP